MPHALSGSRKWRAKGFKGLNSKLQASSQSPDSPPFMRHATRLDALPSAYIYICPLTGLCVHPAQFAGSIASLLMIDPDRP